MPDILIEWFKKIWFRIIFIWNRHQIIFGKKWKLFEKITYIDNKWRERVKIHPY
jgi:hypothetical protein